MESGKPIKLSVFIITLNEERNIRRCLGSVAPIADEIVVVDSYSTDATASICLEFGVRFIRHPFAGYIEQYQYAFEQTQYDHVLNLDADEALSPELLRNIEKIKRNWSYDGYSFNRLNNFRGKWVRHGGWYPDRKMRLWKKPGSRIGGINPHHKVELPEGARVLHLKGDLFHFSFNSFGELMRQANRFSDIWARSNTRAGKTSSLLKILLKPPAAFFKNYIIKRGFLDGYDGYLIATNSAYTSFFKYLKLYRNKIDNSQL